MQTFKATDEDNDIRLDRWFKRYQPQYTHSLLQKLLRKKLVRVNGKRAQASLRLKIGDEIAIKASSFSPEEQDNNQSAKPKMPFKHNYSLEEMTIFENNDFIVINKPHGLASQGGTGVKVSVDDIIQAASERYKLVHRLDRETSGVMVIAKKTSAAATFSKLIQAKQMTKIYWALVKGTPLQQKGIIKNALMKKGDKHQKMEIDEEGKKAVTEYTLLEDMAGRFSWLELVPITGRMHQLRVHCASIGCPIIGDGKYGGAEAQIKGMERKLHLHARRIIIEELGIDVTAPLPKHMQEYAPDA